MRYASAMHRRVAALTIALLLFPHTVVMAADLESSAARPAAVPTQGTTTIADVKLRADGVFSGQIVDAQGNPVASAGVLLNGRQSQHRSTTDAQGRFAVKGVSGGLYRVDAAGRRTFCRVWTREAAPPSAGDGLLLVAPEDFVLGQHCGCGTPVMGGYGQRHHPFRNPVVMGGVVVAAIAIPVAISNSDDDWVASP